MLRIARPAYESLVAQAEAGAPREVCGVLAGRDERRVGDEQPADDDRHASDDDRRGVDDDRHTDDHRTTDSPGERLVAAVHAVANVADHPRTEYRMDPEEQLAAIDRVEESGADVLGFYHSHPAGPTGPSPTDEARATWPGYVYAIVSLDGDEPELGAWEWTGEAFEELAVRVEG